MADFNQILDPGDFQNGLVNTVIEIPMGSLLKVEWDSKRAAFKLDRVEPSIFAKPVNYGFIPGTIDEDGDELDTLVICSQPIPTGTWLTGRIIGALNFEDAGTQDHKIVIVPLAEQDSGKKIQSLDDLDESWKLKIEHHFQHYKDLKALGTTKVMGWGSINDAQQIITQSVERFHQTADNNLPKPLN
jgi:inorganic pyrophosphatase